MTHLFLLRHDLLQTPESLGADASLLPLLDHLHHLFVGGLELLEEDVGVHAPLRLQQVDLQGQGRDARTHTASMVTAAYNQLRWCEW